MDKKSDPIGVRFKNSHLESIKKIMVEDDTNFSAIIEDAVDCYLKIREKFRLHKIRDTEKNPNGQSNQGSTA